MLRSMHNPPYSNKLCCIWMFPSNVNVIMPLITAAAVFVVCTLFYFKTPHCGSSCVCLQGHNQLVAYSRAAYFCIFCTLIWLLEQLLRIKDLPSSTLYGVTIVCHDALHFFRDLLVGRD